MSLNVWYIDDEPSLCEVFKECFTTEVILIKTFINPNDALEMAKVITPDLLFVDYRLPTTTGDKIAQALLPSIPKYLITGDQSVSTVYDFIEIIQKPYKLKAIKDIIDCYLQKKQVT